MPALDIKAIFQQAMDLESSQRPAFLDRECAGHPEERARVEVLLAALNDAGSFLEHPAIDAVTVQDGSNPPDAVSPTEGTIDYTPDPATPVATSRPIAEGPGNQIGPYTLREKIGEGGMGVVYLAEQERPVRRRVALKIIKPGMDTEQVVARFEAERQALAIMDHPSIAKVLDAGATESGRPYFVMELVKGVPITEYCDTVQLNPKERLELFIPVCAAVQHAHQKGIIHRDIKPSNVLVAMQDGVPVPKVIDFGIAKATEQRLTERSLFTQHGAIVGTLEYMSPEQAEMSAMDIDTRTDIYALGVMLYELLTGTTPLERARLRQAGYAEILKRIKEEEPPKPSTRLSDSGESLPSVAALRKTEPSRLPKLVRGDLDWIVMKALEKDRTRRYETANGFARDIQRHLDGDPVEACPPSASYKMKKFARKHRAALTTAGAFAVLLIAATAVSVGLALWADRERSRAVKAEAAAKGQRDRAEDRERLAIDAVKRYGDAVASNAALKNNPGLESLRKDLLKEPLAFFQTLRIQLQADRNTGERSLLRLAAASFELGDLTNEIGDRRDALAAYRESLAIWRALAEANPAVAAYRNNLANTHDCVGELLRTLGEFDEALREQHAALEIQEALAKADPTFADYQNNLANSYNSMGALLDDTGQPGRALQAYQSALDIRKKLAEANPASAVYQDNLALSHHNIGILLREIGQPERALQASQAALDIRKKLAEANPAVAAYRNNLAISHGSVGAVLTDLGKLGEALRAANAALDIHKALVEANPTVTEYRYNLALSHQNVAYMLDEHGKPGEATQAYRDAIDIHKALAGANPTVTKFQDKLALSHGNIGLILGEAGKLDEALESHLAAYEIQKTLVRDHPESLNFASSLGGSLNNIALIDMESKRFDQARVRLEEAILWQRKALAAYPANPEYRQFMANHLSNLNKTLRQLGDPEGLAALQREIAEFRASDPARAALDARLDAVIRGERGPADGAERLALAQRAYDRGLHASAAKLLGEALSANPALAEGRVNQHRYNAACSAALAGCGQAKDDPPPDDAARVKLRKQALGWLNDELHAWKRAATTTGAENRPLVARTLAHWKQDADLAGIRDEASLAIMQDEERAAFAKLWADVDALLAKVQP